MTERGSSVEAIDDGQLLARTVTAQLGAVEIPIKPFRLRNGLAMDRIFGAYALLHLGDSCRGFGYTMHIDRAGATAACHEMDRMLSDIPKTTSHLLALEELTSGEGTGPATRSACNAISLAAWDLTGTYLNQPCATLWGGQPRPLSCYDSYTLAFAEDDQLATAAQDGLARGMQRAKMIVGQHPLDEDIERVESVLAVLGPHKLAVDALCSWHPEQANAFMSRVSKPLLWVEDPVPYDQLSQVHPLHPIAAGERCNGLAELLDLARRGATELLVDPGLLGGPMRQLQVSRVLSGIRIRVGFHAYPHYLAHIAACLENPLPVEIQNWGDPLFTKPLALSATGEIEITGSGFGFQPDMDAIKQFSCMTRHLS